MIHLRWIPAAAGTLIVVLRLLCGAAPIVADEPRPANEPRPAVKPAEPPNPGPAPGVAPNDDAKRRAALREAEEERRSRPIREAQAARDRADRLRADYEAANKPGPVPKAAAGTFDTVVAAYKQAIDRDVTNPEVAKVVASCYQRLAGAFTYTHQRDKELDTLKAAARKFAGTPNEVEAAFGVGLCYLQSLHRPAEALPWLRQAQALAGNVPDPQERTKWLTATGQAIARGEREMKQ
jgi:hypothetical protein